MLRYLSQCFSSEPINTGRQIELDIAKGFAILFMVFSHVYMDLSDWSSPFLTMLIYNVLGGPFSAPVFMFCMGIGIGYTKRQTPKDLFLRGLQLLAYAVMLDFFRYALPAFLYQSLQGTVSLKEIFLYSFGIDILQFSGMFFIFFSILMHLGFRRWMYILIALGASVLGQFLNGFAISNAYINMPASFLWRSTEYSYFPLLNWSVFPIAGYLFSDHLKRCRNKDALYSTLFPVSALITCGYLVFFILFWSNDDQYYGMGVIHAILALICVIATISFCHIAFRKDSLFVRGMCWMSSNVTKIYCVHWVIIMILVFTFVNFSYKIPSYCVIPFGLLLTALTCTIIQFWNLIRGFLKHK